VLGHARLVRHSVTTEPFCHCVVDYPIVVLWLTLRSSAELAWMPFCSSQATRHALVASEFLTAVPAPIAQ
jgi:hypothetical protein